MALFRWALRTYLLGLSFSNGKFSALPVYEQNLKKREPQNVYICQTGIYLDGQGIGQYGTLGELGLFLPFCNCC